MMRELLQTAAGRARWAAELGWTAVRVGHRTGALRALRLTGVAAMARAWFRSNPSTVLRVQGANNPDQVALVAKERSLTYGELDRRVDQLAAALVSRGVGPGEAVLVMLRNVPEFFVVQIGAARLGARAVSVSYRSTATELGFLMRHSAARALFFDAACGGVVKQALAQLDPSQRVAAFVTGGSAERFESYDELLADAAGTNWAVGQDRGQEGAVVMYTSGTTGKPKGAVRQFDLDSVLALLSFIGETPMRVGQTHVTVCPLYHATAFGFANLSMVLGSKVVLLDGFEPEPFLVALEQHRAHHTAVVPTMLHRLMQLGPAAIRQRDTSALEAIFVGGAPVGGKLALDTMGVLGDKLHVFYGATETGFVTVATPADLRQAPGSIGRVVAGNDVRLLDRRGEICGPGEVGELYVRSGNLQRGYHADAGATRASMRDGFFSVGDLASVDHRGFYFLVGRKHDLIISGGVNVYPAEVEAALLEHPSVGEAAVVGVADPEWGERVRAFVVVRPGATVDEAELLAHCRSRLAGPKRPRDVVLVDELPRNATGKVLKRELKQR